MLNYLCANDISDEDCGRCLVHGIKLFCPEGCEDFKDVRKQMSPDILKKRNELMKLMGVEDDPRWD